MIIEKILPVIIVAALFVTGLSGVGASSVAVTEVVTETVAVPEVTPEDCHVILMDRIGADLMARGKEAGFVLDLSLSCHTASDGSSIIVPDVEIRSAIGTTMYGENTVDWQLMREIEYAVIDANLFELSPDALSELKNYYYTPDENYADVDVEGINIHINETPFGYEAILMMRYMSTDFLSGYERAWSCSYSWDELTYDSRSN